MKLMYNYIISYSFNQKDSLIPHIGSAHLFRKKKIKSLEDINDVISCLKNENDGALNLAVHNLIYLGRHWHK